MSRSLKRAVLLAIFAALMSSCNGGENKQKKLDQEQQQEFVKSLPKSEAISVLWDRDLGEFNTVGFNFVVDNNIGYSIDAKGQMRATDLSNGDLLWKNKYKREITAAVGLGQQALFAVDNKSRLVAFSRTDGEQLWRSDINSEVLIPPVVAANTVIVKTLDAKLVGFDLDTGEQRWTYRHDKPGLSLRGGSTPLVARNFLFTGFEDGRLVAVDANTGKLLWDVPVGKSSGRDEIQRLTDIDAQPVIDGNNLYVTAFQRRIMALDIIGGQILWTRPVSSFIDFEIDSRALYIVDVTNVIFALDRNSGNTFWVQEDLKGLRLTSITKLRDKLIVTDEDNLYILGRDDGEVLGRQKLSGGSPLVAPVVINETAYYLLSNGDLKALALSQ